MGDYLDFDLETYRFSASDIPELVGSQLKADYFLPFASGILNEPRVSSRRLMFLAITEGGMH